MPHHYNEPGNAKKIVLRSFCLLFILFRIALCLLNFIYEKAATSTRKPFQQQTFGLELKNFYLGTLFYLTIIFEVIYYKQKKEKMILGMSFIFKADLDFATIHVEIVILLKRIWHGFLLVCF
ncbi:hypothetical protein ACJX0J_020570, partial [Zea mays]